MAVIPAICQVCQTVWFHPSLFSIPGDATISLTRCTVGPCPFCGEMGEIPDGVYGSTSALLTSESQFLDIVSALEEIGEMVNKGGNSADVAQAIDEKYPVLKSLKGLLPTDAKALALYVTTILAVLKYVGEAPSPPPEIHVHVDMQEVLRDILAKPPIAPHGSPESPPE